MNITDGQALALLHMEAHGLFDECWHFEFESCKRTLGRCHYYGRKITLSKWYVELNNEDDVEDTILHEIAHAVSFMRYGMRGKGHGRLWKSVCREIGARPERLHKGILEYPDNHYKYVDTCGCDITYKRHRVRRGARYRCPKCDEPLFNEQAKRDWVVAGKLLEDILDIA